MKCEHPYMKYEPSVDSIVPFPCGHCYACRSAQARVWVLRNFLESQMHDNFAFVTLTYDNQHLPTGSNLESSAISSFMKRLRYYLPYKVRYYGCGEYGEKRGRPHYHLLIFGLKENDYVYVNQAWNKGRVDVQTPRDPVKSIAYTATYVTKKIGKIDAWCKSNRRQVAPFQRCSLSLGLDFALKHIPLFTTRLRVFGKVWYVGRYLRNKLAEKFSVLEEIKQAGLQMLSVEMEDVLTRFFTETSGKFVNHLGREVAYKLYSRETALVAWKHCYNGDFELQKARSKLFSRDRFG
ncbi:replication initiator protein [Chicken microvirus mg7_19]|nr:replication initiator protein [Chicken microvirus mg7_19]QIR82398.1 replication initiator protein [Chicken microvirus mg8_102]